MLGAVGFELLKLLLGGYMRDVASKSLYGAFGVPVALLLWINLSAKLLLFCAAWTATQSREAVDEASDDAVDEAGGDAVDEAGGDAVDEAGGDALATAQRPAAVDEVDPGRQHHQRPARDGERDADAP